MRLMHALLVVLASLVAATAFAHRDRIEGASMITVSFAPGESVAFEVDAENVAAVVAQIDGFTYRVPREICSKLRAVRFDTVKLLWNGSFSDAASADYFYIQFDMGREADRTFGELPQVQLMFRNKVFSDATLTRPIAEGSWQDAEL